MNDVWGTIIVAVISGAFILAGTYYATKTQLKRDRETRQGEEAERKAKREQEESARLVAQGIDLTKLKSDLERDLWSRLQEDVEDERKKRKELEALLDEFKGKLSIVERDNVLLRINVKEMAERIKDLEEDRDMWRQRALDAEARKGGKRI